MDFNEPLGKVQSPFLGASRMTSDYECIVDCEEASNHRDGQFDHNINSDPNNNTGVDQCKPRLETRPESEIFFEPVTCNTPLGDQITIEDEISQKLLQNSSDLSRACSSRNISLNSLSNRQQDIYDSDDPIIELEPFVCPPSPSSDDETDEEPVRPRYTINSNHNNNKKKKMRIHEARSGAKSKVVNFRLSREKGNQRSNNEESQFRPNKRFHSMQLSSIRVLSNSREPHGIMRKSPKSTMKYGKRLIEKDGRSNVLVTDFGRVDLFSRYFSDIFTTMLDSSWCWVLNVTTLVYISHWVVFGLIYWLFAVAYNDYHKIMESSDDLINNVTANSSSEEDPCVFNVYDFKTSFLFSLESETTIGYGVRTISTACPVAVVCLTVQCIVSAIFDTWVIGICYARLARPDARCKTTMFSNKAVICRRDGKRCLLVRFANLRKSLLLNVTVRARIITLRPAGGKEKDVGYQGMLEQRQLEFENESSALLTAPIEYRHVIDKESPLYDISPHLYNSTEGHDYFEVVFIVTGTLESTGLTMQAQTSYLSSEIMHGWRFVPVVSKSFEQGRYLVNFEHFHDVVEEPLSVRKSKKLKATNGFKEEIAIPLIEERITETEEEVFSNSDDVFASDQVTESSTRARHLQESEL